MAWNGVALATTEAQLVSALSTLLTNLNRCGDRLGLTKSNVLTAGRAKKTGLTPQVWTKNVARLFGAVLKRTNAIEALFQQRQADFTKYGDVSGALQEFGCLHGDQYSAVRVMHQGGLVRPNVDGDIACQLSLALLPVSSHGYGGDTSL